MVEIEKRLKELPLFSQLSPEALAELIQQGEVLTFEPEEVVCWDGDVSDGIYVILEGEVRVLKRDEEGNEFDVNRLQQGECFGEMALLDNQPRSATVACLTHCELFNIEKVGFMNLLVTPATQSTAFSILSVLVQRVRRLTEKYINEQLAQRTLQAEMMAERHRSLAQMVTGVAHELNTPLGVTNMAVDMIAKRVQNKDLTAAVSDNQAAQSILGQMQEASDLALRNIKRAHKLVQNFKKISVSQLDAQRESVALPALVQDILDLFKINARQARLQIVLNDNLPDDQKKWTGYPGHLTQVLTNFLFNIERYAYPNQVGGRIQIALYADNEAKPAAFVLTVQDYGVGITPEHLPQLFEPFFTTGRSKGGTGLGLAIVYNIVTEALHGSIEVESELGKGTCFTVTFPQVID